VAASAAAATALLVTAGVTLTDENAGFRPAAVDAVAPSTSARATEPGSPSVTAPPASAAAGSAAAGSPSATSAPSTSSGTPSSSAPLSSPAGSAAASTPSTAIVSPGLAGPEYPTWAGATADAPFVSFIGDSWTDGAGATEKVGYAYLTGRLLGWTHRVLGVGGSGYVRGGAGNVPFDERILPAVSDNPDVVVIQGSINERSTPSPELAAAVTDTLTRLVRAAGPDTAVVVLGASHVPGVPVEYVDKVNDVVRAEAARQGLLFVDVAAEVWSDPADPSIWADPYHVNDAGAQQIAERLAPVLQAVLAA
jgi:lysophospholipase L1-like esterase